MVFDWLAAPFKKSLRNEDGWLKALFCCGIVLRFATYFSIQPFQIDDHFSVIQFILDHRRLPISGELWEAFQPPLYYLVASGIMVISGLKTLHFFAFLVAAFNFILVFHLIKSTPLISSFSARIMALAFTVFLPHYLFISSFVTNDSFALLFGTLVCAAALRMLETTSTEWIWWLAIFLGLGLLSKYSFFVLVPVAAVMVVLRLRRDGNPWKKSLLTAVLFTVLSIGIGSYKFVENTRVYGKPFVTNVDFFPQFVNHQQIKRSKLEAFTDLNLLKTLREPWINHDLWESPIPVVYLSYLIGYVGITGENLEIRFLRLAIWISRGILIFGFVLLGVFLLRIARITSVLTTSLMRTGSFSEDVPLGELAMYLFLMVTAVAIAMFGVRHYVFSAFNGRYFFPMVVASSLLIGRELDLLRKYRIIYRVIEFSFVGYAVVSVAFIAHLVATHGFGLTIKP